MDVKAPKRKKYAPSHDIPNFPSTREKRCLAVFNGYDVSVSDYEGMNDIYYMGYFGKGSLSKSAPNYHALKDDLPNVLLKQQWENQIKWNSNTETSSNVVEKYQGFNKYDYDKASASVEKFFLSSFESCKSEESWVSWKKKQPDIGLKVNEDPGCSKVVWKLESSHTDSDADKAFCQLVEQILESKNLRKSNSSLPESWKNVLVVDNENEDIENLSATLEKSTGEIQETLKLNLVEAFFLCFALGCIQIQDTNGTELNVNDLWQKFCAAQTDFIEKYVVYHYYRAGGWVVKSGLKYGGDYLLYKTGPAFYHASYLVQVVNEKVKLSWNEFIGMNRLVETFNKDLLLCQVVCSEDVSEIELSTPDVLTKYSVREIMSRRWIPSEERIVK